MSWVGRARASGTGCPGRAVRREPAAGMPPAAVC